MRMISAQIDELRQMADGQVTYRDAREVMLEAADTIWQLRDDLQQANAENERLRRCMELHDEWGEGFRAGCDAVNAVNNEAFEHHKSENAKLRELVDELWSLAYGYVPIESELDAARDMMRELGVGATR